MTTDQPTAAAFASSFTMDALFNAIVIPCIIASLAAAFLAITFLQSGLDKIVDYKGNLSFLREQFSKTILKSMIGIFLPLLLVFEMVSGLLLVAGIIRRWTNGNTGLLIMGFVLSGITFLMLLFGQRVSKQYAGAVSLTGYFIITLIGLLVMTHISY